MKGHVSLIVLILTQVFAFSTAWFESGMKDLARRADHGHGKRRLKEEFCKELERRRRHGDEKDIMREIEKIRRLSDDFALKRLSDILDRIEKESIGEAEEMIRHIIKKLGLPDPPVYKLLDGRFSADEAEEKCKALGGRLAIIRHGIDHSFAWEASSRASMTWVFIGLTKDGRRINWRDGSPLNYDAFTKWYSKVYYSSRKCGIMDIRHGTLSFSSCSAKFEALCQFPKGSLSKPSAPPPPPPPMYKLLDGYFNANDAEKKCRASGGHLAIIRGGTEQSLARKVASKASSFRVFIGLVRNRRGIYWRDGSRMNFHTFRSGNWRKFNQYLQCGVIERSGVWSFSYCGSRFQALCQFPVKPIPEKKPIDSSGDKTSPRPPAPSLPEKESGKKPGDTSGDKTSPRPPAPSPNPPNKKRSLTTDLRFMFKYEVSIRDLRFPSDLVTAIGELLQKDTRDISVLNIRSGSTIVRIRVYLADNEDAESIKATLEREAKLGGILDMKFYGRLRPVVDPFPETGPPRHPQPNMLKVIIPIIVLVFVVTIIVIVLVVIMIKKRRNVAPSVTTPVAQVPEPLPTYKEFTANDYTKPPSASEPNAPPAYDDISKPPIA